MIKALTIWQPWASAIFLGKKYETRSWGTNYRGLVAIHAAKRQPTRAEINHVSNELNTHLQFFLSDPRTRMCVIGVATLTDCIKMTPEFIDSVSDREKRMGHWEEGRYAWEFSEQRWLPQQIEAKGKEGLWTPSNSLTKHIQNLLDNPSCSIDPDIQRVLYEFQQLRP